MEIISAFLGAIIGAVASFVLAEFSNSRSERKKIRASLTSEIELNLAIAEDILEVNDKIEFDAGDARSWEWCEIIPMSDSAWAGVLSTGSISVLGESEIQPLSKAFSLVRRANYTAEKIKAGRYHPLEGKAYYTRVRAAKDALHHALRVMQR